MAGHGAAAGAFCIALVQIGHLTSVRASATPQHRVLCNSPPVMALARPLSPLWQALLPALGGAAPVRPLAALLPSLSIPPIAVAGGHLDRHTQCGAQEEDVLPQETPALLGRQGLEGHHFAQPVLGLWQDQTHARAVSLLRRW